MGLFDNSASDLNETAEEVVETAPVEETEEQEVVDEVETEDTKEQSEESEEDTESDSDEPSVYVINGEEYTEDDLKHAKDYKHLEADYTKKTMALAEDRKNLESKADSLDKLTQELEVLVGEDSEINWQELKEDDPDEYIRLKEKADKRKEALKKAKSNLKPTGLSQEQLVTEFNTLAEANPDWVKRDDKGNITDTTQKYKDDVAAIGQHASELGFTNEEMATFERAPMIQVLLNSMRVKELEAKLKEKQNNVEVVKKKISPKAAKPAAKAEIQQPTSLFSKSIGS
jgi:hypothetical protein